MLKEPDLHQKELDHLKYMYNDQSFSYSWHGLQIKEPMNLQGVKFKHWIENNDSNRKALKGLVLLESW